jgi:ketosteroid isomerase-like protein
MAIPDPDRFAQEWLTAFNAHDIETVLEHFAEDVVFTSPVAARVVPDSGGVIRGKAALRAYWTVALERIPELRFELLGVYAGIDTLVINYRNQAGGLVSEVLTFAGNHVVAGHGTYRTPGSAAAAVVSRR